MYIDETKYYDNIMNSKQCLLKYMHVKVWDILESQLDLIVDMLDAVEQGRNFFTDQRKEFVNESHFLL